MKTSQNNNNIYFQSTHKTKSFNVGDIVFAKASNIQPWPAKIIKSDKNISKYKVKYF